MTKDRLYYANKVLKSSSYEELRELFVNTQEPVKEITESYACLYHMSRIGCKDHRMAGDLRGYTCLHIGDGSWCRTGAIFTFLSKSKNISIDPDASKTGRMDKWIETWKVRNFEFHSKRVEDTDLVIDTPYIITNVHSHAPMESVLEKYNKADYIYVNPCCMRTSQIMSDKQMKQYGYSLVYHVNDDRILSTSNEILIYKKTR